MNEELGLLVKDIFPKYCELYSKDENRLSAVEVSTLSSISKYMNNIKMKLSSKSGVSLNTSQIIIVPPPLAHWDIRMLRALFLKADWITTKDNDTKLMLVPAIEAHVNALQMFGVHKGNFEREGKYMILYIQPSEERDKILYTSVCFQMQCAQELITVSKRLASSDFLLVPCILSSRSICLPFIGDELLAAVEGAISTFRGHHKAIKGETTKVKSKLQIVYGPKSKDSRMANLLTRKLLRTKESVAIYRELAVTLGSNVCFSFNIADSICKD